MNQLATIDINGLTTAEKISIMELLWRDISMKPEDVEVPDWHFRILDERERALANGEDEFIDFDSAMAEIRGWIETQRAAK